MHVDAITLAAVASEWRTLLTGARIDTIIQPTEHAVALQCYAPGIQGEGRRTPPDFRPLARPVNPATMDRAGARKLPYNSGKVTHRSRLSASR